ncbi:hypothetical protein HanPI659440_Chr13g0511701 [Helianthus annuus]|nr:hypothetical protein HanPI659440_Chr13g0511701 [Helianthus annuus]
MGMVRICHFELICRSQGLEPSVKKFRAFYQLIRNMGFYSFAQRGAKKILINPPKSFHDWKIKFFFIREEVMHVSMIFRESDMIEKEEFPIPKTEDWYLRLMANPNRVLESRPLRGVTSAGKEIFYLSSEESVGSSNEELSSWSKIFAGVVRDLGIDPEEKKTKKVATKKSTPKKTVTVEAGATSKKAGGARATAEISQKGTLHFRQSNLEDYVVASDSLEGLSRIGEKPKSSAAAASKSAGSAGSRAPESGVTPSSLHEEEEEEVEDEGVRVVARKRSREEAAATTPPPLHRRLLPPST